MASNTTTINSTLRVPSVPGSPRLPRAQALVPASGPRVRISGISSAAEGAGALRSTAADTVSARRDANDAAVLGGALSDIGEAGFEIGMTFERARQEEAIAAAVNRGQEQLDELATQLKESGDFLAADRAFSEGSAKIAEEIGNSLMTPNERKEFENRFDTMRLVRKQRVHSAAFEGQQSRALATLNESVDRFARDAAAASTDEERAAVNAAAEQTLLGAAGAGLISPAKAASLSIKFKAQATEYAARDLMLTDPQAALGFLDSDEAKDNLEPLQRTALKEAAHADLRRDEARGRAQSKQILASLKKDVKDIGDISSQGYPPSPDLLDDARIKADAIEDGTERAIALHSVKVAEKTATLQRELMVLAPAEAQATLSALETQFRQTGTSPDQADILKAGYATLGRMKRELAKDPLSWANRTGVIEIAPLGDDLAGGLAARRQQASHVAEVYGVEPKFFTEAERAGLKTRFRQGSAQERVELAASLSAGLGQNGVDLHMALSEISAESNGTAQLSRLVASGRASVALEGFRGQKAIEEGTVKVEKEAARRRDTADAVLGGALDSRLAGVRGGIAAAADAIYFARVLDKGETGFDENLYREALQDAAGRAGGKGGVGTYNGRALLLPPSMDEDEFAAAIGFIDDDDMTRLSAHGGEPMFRTPSGQRRKVKPDELARGYFVTVAGNGGYQISMTDPADRAPVFVVDGKTGLPYVLDLSAPGVLDGLRGRRAQQ